MEVRVQVVNTCHCGTSACPPQADWDLRHAGLTVWRSVAYHQVCFPPPQGIQYERNRRWQRDIRLQRRHILQRCLQCQHRGPKRNCSR